MFDAGDGVDLALAIFVHALGEETFQFFAATGDFAGLARAGCSADGDVLAQAGLFFDGCHVQDAVEIEPHPAEHRIGPFNGREPPDLKVPHVNIFHRVGIVALINVDVDAGLSLVGSGIFFRARDGQGRVALDYGMVAVGIFPTVARSQIAWAKGEGGDVDQHALDGVPAQAAGEHACAKRHAKIRVQVLARRFAAHFLEHLDDQRRAG